MKEILITVVLTVLVQGGLLTLFWKKIKAKVDETPNNIDNVLYNSTPTLLDAFEKALEKFGIEEKYIYTFIANLEDAYIKADAKTEGVIVENIRAKKEQVLKKTI